MPRRCALLFGADSSGLSNDELELADYLVQVPAADAFSSLNLAICRYFGCVPSVHEPALPTPTLPTLATPTPTPIPTLLPTLTPTPTPPKSPRWRKALC